MTATAGEQLMTVDDAAARLSTSVRFVRRLIAERRSPALTGVDSAAGNRQKEDGLQEWACTHVDRLLCPVSIGATRLPTTSRRLRTEP